MLRALQVERAGAFGFFIQVDRCGEAFPEVRVADEGHCGWFGGGRVDQVDGGLRMVCSIGKLSSRLNDGGSSSHKPLTSRIKRQM